MSEVLFLPLVLVFLGIVLNPDNSCEKLIFYAYKICGSNNNNECFKPFDDYPNRDNKKIKGECLSKNAENFFKDSNRMVHVTYKPESMTHLEAMEKARKKCKEINKSGVGFNKAGPLYYVCEENNDNL